MKKKLMLLIAVMLSISLAACKTIESIPPTEMTESSITESVASTPEALPTETSVAETEQTTTEQSTETSAALTETTTATTVETTAATTVSTTAATTAATTVATTQATPTIYSSSYTPLNYNEQIGVWISFLEFQNILKGKSEAQFRASVGQMYDDCVSMGINTVYVHARSHGDAFYESDIYPWSKNITGSIDGAPSFDPYQILVDEAHKRGLSFHAWINPMRTLTVEDMNKISDSYQIKKWANNKNGTYIVNVGGTYWLSPAYPEVRKMIVNGAKEIVSKYNVDGVHIDDYFYQSSFGKSFDSEAYSQSNYTSLSQFRLDSVSLMVKELYSGVKSVNPSVQFGISPAGNISNLYSAQYADVRKWCSTKGYCDYIVPQIYWGFTHSTAAYDKVLNEWCAIHTCSDVKMVVGLAAYRAPTGEMAGETNVLSKQIQAFRQKSNYGGAAFFRYESLFKPSSASKAKMDSEVQALKELLT